MSRTVVTLNADSDFGRCRLIYFVRQRATPSAPDVFGPAPRAMATAKAAFDTADQIGAVDDAPPQHHGELRVYLNTYGHGGMTQDEWRSLVATVDALLGVQVEPANEPKPANNTALGRRVGIERP